MRLFILFSVALLGFALFLPQTGFHRSGGSPLVKWLPGLPTTGTTPAQLWTSMVTGDEGKLSRDVKKSYYRLGLGHLFTPSGVHLAALSPLLKRLPMQKPFYGLLAILATFTPGLLALGRVAWLKTSGRSGRTFAVFALVLVIEGALYSWQAAPISWVCSWLFLGLNYFAPRSLRWAWFVVGQMLLCWVLHQPLSLLVLPVALLVGTPLGLMFPALLLLSFVPVFWLHTLVLKIVQVIHGVVMWVDQIHVHLPALQPHAGHFIVAIAWLCARGKWKTPATAVSLIVLTSATGPWLKASSYSAVRISVPSPHAKLVYASRKNGYSLEVWSDGVKCRKKLENGLWKGNCRAPKSSARFEI